MKKRLQILSVCLLLLGFLLPQQAEAAQYPYFITVNLTKNIVTVYERDETGAYSVPKKAFLCSGGNYTPEGTFRTSDKYRWRILFGDVYGQYATRIDGHILFHSVPYFEQDNSTLEYAEYNKLGETASAGCIRLTVADAKWLYDNCPAGTTVRMYRSEKEEPLQPEKPQKIDPTDTLRRGWDPTDPDPDNPWMQRKAELRTLTLQTEHSSRTLEVYYEDWRYFLGAKDIKQVFAYMGITLILPENAGNAAEDTVKIWYRAAQQELTRYQREGQAYYSLRELAELTGISLSWDKQAKRILLHGGGEEIALFEAVAG